jgi:hypothetical protein
MTGAAVQSISLSDSGKQEKSAITPEKEQIQVIAVTPRVEKTLTPLSKEKIEPKFEANKTPAKQIKQIKPVVPSDEIGDELLQEQELNKEHDLVMPESRISASADVLDTKLIIVDNSNENFKLHYKYTEGQLYLYGVDKTYNIIDLPNQSQRYIYYDGNYYKLNINQSEIVPMPKVTNVQEIQLADSYNKEMKQE